MAEAFQSDLLALPADSQQEALVAILAIPAAFREPARHTGLGLRKVHPHIWEIRVGLPLRVLFTLEPDRARLLRVASHDEVRRYLRNA